MPPVREIVSRHHAFATLEGDGVEVLRAIPGPDFEAVGPFIFLDHFGPIPFEPGKAKGASAHPHAGIETLTLLIEGRMRHKDSLGNASSMGPGDVQWMRAGRGVVHDEQPDAAATLPGERTHGVQLWLNLPAGEKRLAPTYRHIPADEIPLMSSTRNTTRARLVAGAADGARGPLETFGRPLVLQTSFATDDSIVLPTPEVEELAVYVVSGHALIGGHAAPASAGQLARLGSGQALVLSAPAGSEVLVIGGDRLDAPIFRYGPFVMNSAEELQQTLRDYHAGRMGQVPAG